MLITKEVEIRIAGRNIYHFRELGYDIKINDKIVVPINHLKDNSSATIKLKCDYCQREYETKFVSYTTNKKKSKGTKDACSNCKIVKMKETMLEEYGTDVSMQLDFVREKIKETSMQRYGTESPLQSDLVKQKIKETCIEKYGVDNPMKNIDIQNKLISTFNEVYGADNPFQNEDIKEKIKQTNLQRYGFENPMQNPDIKKRVFDSINESLRKNGTAPCSSQQRYIHSQLGGELNYLYSRMWLDIAFPSFMTYLEYDGSGHDIDVKYKYLTQEEFNQKEMKRYFFLKSKGWKQIRIISTKDLVPSKNVLDHLISYSKEKLKTNNWIEFNLDNSQIITKNEIIHYNFKATKLSEIK